MSLSEALFSLRRAALLPPVQRVPAPARPCDRAQWEPALRDHPESLPQLARPLPNLHAVSARVTCRTVAAVMPSVRLPYEFSAPVRTDRLVLRAMTSQDVDDIHAYQSRPDVCRYLMFEPRTREEVAERSRSIPRHSSHNRGRVIGDIYFAIKDAANASAEIGWTLHPDYAGSGYMTEAASAMLSIAFNDLELHRVRAELDARNRGSAALCKRLGMRRRLSSERTCGSRASGATRRSTRSSIANGPPRGPPDTRG